MVPWTIQDVSKTDLHFLYFEKRQLVPNPPPPIHRTVCMFVKKLKIVNHPLHVNFIYIREIMMTTYGQTTH